jgi:hypothetical protein
MSSSFLNPTAIIPTPISVLQATAAILPPFPLWLYKLLAAFPITGLLGLDHFAIGSNFSGLMKIFINIVTLGSWYAFDVVQAYNKPNIGQTGLEVPFFKYGEFGKNKITDEPMKNMTKNTQVWLYLLIASLFFGLYMFSSLFLSKSNELVPTLVRYFSKFTFWAGVAIIGFTAIFFFTTRSSSFSAVTTATTPGGVLSSLYSATGLTNPALPKPSGVSSILSSLPIARSFMGGGKDEIEEMKNIINSIKQEGGAKKESFQHIYFGLVLLLIPAVGFTIYTLRKTDKK